MIAWMGLALMVSTRLWLGGVVSVHRDRNLADQLLHQVRACCRPLQALLVCTDGWSAYPGSIQRAFREKVKRTAGRGRAYLQVWPQLCIATVIKRTQKKRVVEVLRKMTRGTLEQANTLLQASLGGSMLNTAFIERFNGTMRERLDSYPQMSSRRPAPGGTGNRHVSDWMHLQLVLSASRIESGQACRFCMYPCDGSGINGSYLERWGSPDLQGSSRPLDRTQAAGTTSQTSGTRSDCAQTTTWSPS